MAVMDLIGDLINGRITEEAADRVLERLQEAWRQDAIEDWALEAGVSSAEYKAILHGAGLGEVASWRASGWPTVCCRCGGPLDYLSDDWMVASSVDRAVLMHLECPSPPLADPKCPEHPEIALTRLTNEDPQLRSARDELAMVLEQMFNGELEPWQVTGFIESVYFDAVSTATIEAYEQVYGRSPRRPTGADRTHGPRFLVDALGWARFVGKPDSQS